MITDREKVLNELGHLSEMLFQQYQFVHDADYYGAFRTVDDAIDMLKAQPKWIPVKEKLPKRNGDYLVISDSPICRRILIASFAKNLDKVDKWAFPFRGENRPGWYDYSCDWGYFEHDNVTHWMPLPEMPEGE